MPDLLAALDAALMPAPRARGDRRSATRARRAALGGDGGPEDLHEPVDVGAVAALGERDQQPAAVVVAAGERVQVDPGVDPLLGAAALDGGDVQRRLAAGGGQAQRELADRPAGRAAARRPPAPASVSRA